MRASHGHAKKSPNNLIHVVFDNGVYESSGGTKTAAADGVDFAAVAKGIGINRAFSATSVAEFKKLFTDVLATLAVYVDPVPKSSRVEEKYRHGHGPMSKSNTASAGMWKRLKAFQFFRLGCQVAGKKG